jgi:hypothetical protein
MCESVRVQQPAARGAFRVVVGWLLMDKEAETTRVLHLFFRTQNTFIRRLVISILLSPRSRYFRYALSLTVICLSFFFVRLIFTFVLLPSPQLPEQRTMEDFLGPPSPGVSIIAVCDDENINYLAQAIATWIEIPDVQIIVVDNTCQVRFRFCAS